MTKVSMPDPTFLDKTAIWVNLAYIVWVALSLTLAVLAVFLSNQRALVRDAEIKRIQADSARQVAVANQLSAEATERAAASNVLVAEAESKAATATLAEATIQKRNLELSVELQRETQTRLQLEQRLAGQPPVSTPVPVVQQTPPARIPPIEPPPPTRLPPVEPTPPARLPPVEPTPPAPLPPVEQQSRLLTAEQERALVSHLLPFPRVRLSLLELMDPEAGAFARQITAALTTAQWSVAVNRVGALTPPQYGIIVVHRPGSEEAEAFIEMMKSFNVSVFERISDQPFEVIVGLKPLR